MFFVSMRKKKDNILPVLVENNMCHWDFFALLPLDTLGYTDAPNLHICL